MRRRLVLLLAAAAAVTGAFAWRRRRAPAPSAQLGLDGGDTQVLTADDSAMPELLSLAADVRRAFEATP